MLFSSLHDCIQDCFALPATCAQRLQFLRLIDKHYSPCSLNLCFDKSKMLLMNTLAVTIMLTTVNISDYPLLRIPCILDFA